MAGIVRRVKAGDEVLAWDPVSNGPVLKPVLGTSSRMTQGDVYKLTLADAAGKRSTTIVTGNHPYLLAANDNGPMVLAANDNQPKAGAASILRIAPGGDWKIVRNLAPGDQVRTALNGHVDGGRLLQGPGDTLLSVISVELDRSPRQVYNFEVDGLHAYAVGELGEWVHNGPRPGSGGAGPGGYDSRIPAKRVHCNTRKLAYELAKAASAPGQEPVVQPPDCNQPPHYHPVDCKGKQTHDHYYFPRRRF